MGRAAALSTGAPPAAAGLVLGIETATAVGGVALVSVAGDLVGETTLRSRESHAERILPALASLLGSIGAAPADLSAVGVSSGPGSFTGLRAGVATAKGLAFSLGVPLYGVSTLETLAANLPCGPELVCAVLNARRGEVFRGRFRVGPHGLERVGEEEVVPADSFAAGLPPGSAVVGEPPDAGPHSTRPGPAVLFAPAHLSHPRAAVVAFRALAALRAMRPSELETLLPRYLRPPDAVPPRPPAKIACCDAQLHPSPDTPSLTPPGPSASIRSVPTRRGGRK